MLASLYVPFLGEKMDMPSMTEPNQVLSVSEILARYGSGALVSASRGVYDESDEDFEDDVTRMPGFDFLDAYMIEQELKAKQEQAATEDIEQSDSKEVIKTREDESSSEQKTDYKDSASV